MENHPRHAEQLYRYISIIKQKAINEQVSFLESEYSSLSLRELTAILITGETGPIKMSDLAHSLNLALSTMTGIADKLIRLRLITRKRSTSDRRVVTISLTKKGAALHRSVLEQSIAFYKILLDSLDGDEQEHLIELFGKISRSMFQAPVHAVK
ncbi:MarR family winged helix-turn-helix transcriptional regulator [candidate division KSB1 bacterium]